ncbi:MAG TPA: hypothetical protein VJ753_07320 [Rhizomicrobium sp.]|nr:hypothetical protein [Rhizomicrobium sp.]
MASEIVLPPSLAHPFLRPGTNPPGAEEQRRRALSRTTSWALVALLHVFFFFSFVLGIRPFDMRNRTLVETILTVPQSGNNQREDSRNYPIPLVPASPRMLSAPAIPPPPPIFLPDEKPQGEGPPTDILGVVGRELACSAGSWEHLTSVERARCGLYPWRAVKLPNGSLVMIPRTVLPRLKEAPDTQFSVNTGADQLRSDVQAGIIPGSGGCPILQNTPCVHVTPAMRAATGDR